MKTPDEIKKGLEACGSDECHGQHTDCPYEGDLFCLIHVCRDARVYIHRLENHIGELTEKVEQLEAEQPKWISVYERLPDNHGNFITQIHCDNGGWIEVNTFDHTEKEWWHDAGNRTVEATEFVTHWMPLPAPPKEE